MSGEEGAGGSMADRHDSCQIRERYLKYHKLDIFYATLKHFPAEITQPSGFGAKILSDHKDSAVTR